MSARIRPQITTVLFDLDGTLLPMDLEEFTQTYFGLLAQKAAPYGYEPQSLIAAVWKGTRAMMHNDGSCTNEDRFWQVFAQEMGPQSLAHRPVFDDFYRNEFDQVKAVTRPTPRAAQTVRRLRALGLDTVLATNPLFPRVAVETRLRWIGLGPEDFSHITTYENSTFCKPDPRYYAQILTVLGRPGASCLMVGNDADEDLAAGQVGMDCFLLTDCLINTQGKDIAWVPAGGFDALDVYLFGPPSSPAFPGPTDDL